MECKIQKYWSNMPLDFEFDLGKLDIFAWLSFSSLLQETKKTEPICWAWSSVIADAQCTFENASLLPCIRDATLKTVVKFLLREAIPGNGRGQFIVRHSCDRQKWGGKNCLEKDSGSQEQTGHDVYQDISEKANDLPFTVLPWHYHSNGEIAPNQSLYGLPLP